MEEEAVSSEKDQMKNENQTRPGSDVEGVIRQLMNIESMFQEFIDAESEGMIICENCYDNVFDDDENICTWEDEEGIEHRFCCRECMEEWKKQECNHHA